MIQAASILKWRGYLREIVDDIGGMALFWWDLFLVLRSRPCRLRLVMVQIDKVTTQSFPTVAMAGFFVGAILAVQFSIQLSEFGALGYLGGLTTSATFREVGPLLIAFMLSGKIGAFTAAELGTMRVTEQIDAIRCLGADPIQEIILPRYLGIVVSSFFLLVVGMFMSLFGGILMANVFAGISPEEYVRHIHHILNLPSVLGGLFKCLVFSTMLALVCTYKGYSTSGGARGVGRAVVQTAMISMIGIVVTDWITSVITEGVNLFFGGGTS